jgi:hypothetical protein
MLYIKVRAWRPREFFTKLPAMMPWQPLVVSEYLDAEDEDAGWVATSGYPPQLRGTLQQSMPADHSPIDRGMPFPKVASLTDSWWKEVA